MTHRTDLQYVNGRVRAVDNRGADTIKPLPEVAASDALQSDAWGDSWRKDAGIEDGAIESLAMAQASISRSFKDFMELRGMRDPERTQAHHLRQLAQDFNRSITRLAGQADRAQERAKQRLEEIEGQFRERVKWSERDAQELRSVVRGMDDKARADFIDSALRNGDGQAIAAILGAHPSLSGISADMQAAYRSRAMQLHTPELHRLEKTIKKAREKTSQAFLDLLTREEDITAKKIRDHYDKEQRAALEARKKAAEGREHTVAQRWL